MHCLRALILEHRHMAMALLVLALCMKAIMPAGFMLSPSGSTVLTVKICADSTNSLKSMRLILPGKEGNGGGHSDTAKKEGHCAYSGLAKVAVGGADAILLAIAFAFILMLGFAPTQRPPFRQLSYLRPPLRGPPAAA